MLKVIFFIGGHTQECQIWPQIGADWHQMGQIWDFLNQFSVNFGSLRQNEQFSLVY